MAHELDDGGLGESNLLADFLKGGSIFPSHADDEVAFRDGHTIEVMPILIRAGDFRSAVTFSLAVKVDC